MRVAETERQAIDGEQRAIESARCNLETEKALQELTRQLSEERVVVDSLTTLLTEHEEARACQLAEHENLVRSLTARLAETERSVNAFSTRAAESERNATALAAKFKEREGTISSLSGQLSQKERELQKITSTLGWRLLNAYGPIKYRYLLPVYRLLGLPPYRRGSSKKEQPGPMPTPWPEIHTSVDVSPEREQARQPLEHESAEQEFDELRRVLSSESHAYDVVCFPIIDWDFRFQRPQQLMSRFAAAGHRVFYLSQTFRVSGEPYVITEKRHNVYEVSLRGEPLNVYADSLNDRSRDAIFGSIDALRRDFSLGATVAVVQLPFWWPLVKQTRDEFAWPIVYDCMDHHAGFSTNRLAMIGQERGLLSSADLVVASSSFLSAEASLNNSSVLLLRNGCEYDHFAKATGGKSERPVIGYYGAIADWFDSDLVADLA